MKSLKTNYALKVNIPEIYRNIVGFEKRPIQFNRSVTKS